MENADGEQSNFAAKLKNLDKGKKTIEKEKETLLLKKNFLKNKNPNKIVDIVEKILDFNKQQKGKGHPYMLASRLSGLACIAKVFDHTRIKILTPKQILQRLP